MDKRKKLWNLAGCGLIAAVLGASLSMLITQALVLPAHPGQVFMLCAGAALLMMVGGWSRAGKILSGLLWACVLAVCSLPAIGLWGQIKGLFAALGGAGESLLSSYGSLAAGIMGLLLTILFYWMARMSGGVYPSLTLSVLLMMGCWFFTGQLQPLYSLTALSALAAMLARARDEKISYLRAIPAAVLACALALAFLPPAGTTWQPLAQAAQKVRELFDDYFMFTDPRTTYSISADGFQPMGELLGGPAQPSLRDVMEVEADRPLLLRGSVKRTYTTYSWTENALNSRYVFIDPLRRAVRDQVFDSTRLDGLDLSGAFVHREIRVSFLSQGLSSLFVPHRITDFSAPLDLATYFSSSGEVFITRNVDYGDQYALSAYLPTDDVDSIRRLLSQAARRGDDGLYRQMKLAYTALPQGIDQQVYLLARQITDPYESPYNKALALQNHLMQNYTYTLNAAYPPQGRDFVSHFLLDSKEGYCSYFASAMAVMARMAGLPSRYVEGYLVPHQEGETTIVTGKNAHAWVEIYFEGAGWLPFNPTPGSGDSYRPPQGDEDEQPSAPPPEEEPSDGENDPSPTPQPEEGEQPDAGEGEEDADSSPQEDMEEEQPPEEDAQEEPWEEPPEENAPENNPPSLLWLAILGLLLLIALAALWVMKRLQKSDPAYMTRRRRKNPVDKLAIWYRALLMALEHQGQTPAPGETPAQFASRLVQAGLIHPDFEQIARQLSLNRYARQKIDGAALGQARKVYAQLIQQFKPLEKARWLWRRIIHGPGSSKQIP